MPRATSPGGTPHDGASFVNLPNIPAGAGVIPAANLPAAGAGALTRVGGSQTEQTTTSLTAVDLMTISGLTIPVEVPILIQFSYRKSAGATGVVGFGLKLNTTVVAEAITTLSSPVAAFPVLDLAHSAFATILLGPRIADYLKANLALSQGVAIGAIAVGRHALRDADMPLAEITSISIRAIVADALITAAIGDIQIYTYEV